MSIPHHPFYFMRHGETDWNRSNRIMGQTDIPLNEKGIRQAHDAKEILMTMEFANIYSSPLQRARQTAEILKEEFGHPIDYIDHLKERGWGKGEGQLSDFKGIEITTTNIPEGAEHYNELEARVILALKKFSYQLAIKGITKSPLTRHAASLYVDLSHKGRGNKYKRVPYLSPCGRGHR